MPGVPRLNTRDRAGLVHEVFTKPTDLVMGRTACGFFFTWPLFSQFERPTRWEGTEDMPTCLACIVRPEFNP